jgi:hypothetical protein
MTDSAGLHDQAPAYTTEGDETVDVPCPRCGRPTTWVLCYCGTFYSVEELRRGCGCDLADDEWLDLGGEA